MKTEHLKEQIRQLADSNVSDLIISDLMVSIEKIDAIIQQTEFKYNRANKEKGVAYSILISALFWVFIGIFLGRIISDNVELTVMSPDEWMLIYTIITGVVAIIGIIFSLAWLISGNNNLPTIKDVIRRWNIYFTFSLIIAILFFLCLAYIYQSEGMNLWYYFVVFIIIMLLGPGSFWLSSFIFTPIQYENTVLGKR